MKSKLKILSAVIISAVLFVSCRTTYIVVWHHSDCENKPDEYVKPSEYVKPAAKQGKYADALRRADSAFNAEYKR